jgi:hypothetical protein
MVMAVALLLTVSNGGLFGGGEAQAQITEGCTTFLLEQGLLNVNFKCYVIAGDNLGIDVTLNDQFHNTATPGGPEVVTVRQSQLICTPANKTVGEVSDSFATACPGFHLKCYNVVPSGLPVNNTVVLRDQFSPPDETVRVTATQYLCEGAMKNPPSDQ